MRRGWHSCIIMALLLLLLSCSSREPLRPGTPHQLSSPLPLTTTHELEYNAFIKTCGQTRGYPAANCDCALREVSRQFVGTERTVALFYLSLYLIAEQDMLDMMDYFAERDCEPVSRQEFIRLLPKLHAAPAEYFLRLRRFGMTAEQFKRWGHDNNIRGLRDACLPPQPGRAAGLR